MENSVNIITVKKISSDSSFHDSSHQVWCILETYLIIGIVKFWLVSVEIFFLLTLYVFVWPKFIYHHLKQHNCPSSNIQKILVDNMKNPDTV